MRDILSKLDAIITESALNPSNPKDDYNAKKQALDDLEADPIASKDPEISAAIDQRRADLEKEARTKGFTEDEDIYQIGDDFGISISQDFEIGTQIVDILEDGVVIDLDETALDFLSKNGFTFEEVVFGEDGGDPEIRPGMRVSQGTVVKVDGNTVTVKASNGDLMLMNIHDVSIAEHRIAEEKQKGVDGKACWKGYKRMGTKQKGGKTVDNCVKVGEDLDMNLLKAAQGAMKSVKKDSESERNAHKPYGYRDDDSDPDESPRNDKFDKSRWKQYSILDKEVDEAEYQGRDVPLGKPMAGDVKKSKVYVKNPQGNVVKVNFGDKKMRIKKSNPARKKSFRARHNCDNPGPRHKARYWSCRAW